MKSNEEYLDELLKAMETDDGSTSSVIDSSMEEIPTDMFSDDLLTEDDDLLQYGQIEAETPLEESNVPLPGYEKVPAKEEVAVFDNHDDLSASSLEQLMAEIQGSSQNFEDIDFSSDDIMSEESIDDLLNAAKSSVQDVTDELPPVSEEGFTDFDLDLEGHEEVSDIKELLDMADNNELFEETEIPIEEEQVFSMEDLDSLLDDHFEGAEDAPKAKKKRKKSRQESDGDSKSGFGKILSLLFEEEPEEMEPAEAADMNLSEENKNILTQLDKEEKKKKKAKPKKEKTKGKKKKGEEIEEEGENTKKKAKKVPRPKKEKKPKKEKPVKEVIPEKPEKLLPKKKVVVTSIFAASILIAILFLEYLIPPMLTLTAARESYNQQKYADAYQEYYGESLSEGDEERFQTSRAVMRMQTNLDSYNNFLKMGDEVKALHYLLEGVHVKDDVYALAGTYSATAEVESVYSEILTILSTEYGLAEAEAMELVNESSDLVYTKKLQAIIGGAEYVENTAVSTEISQEDMLPEDEE